MLITAERVTKGKCTRQLSGFVLPMFHAYVYVAADFSCAHAYACACSYAQVEGFSCSRILCIYR